MHLIPIEYLFYTYFNLQEECSRLLVIKAMDLLLPLWYLPCYLWTSLTCVDFRCRLVNSNPERHRVNKKLTKDSKYSVNKRLDGLDAIAGFRFHSWCLAWNQTYHVFIATIRQHKFLDGLRIYAHCYSFLCHK